MARLAFLVLAFCVVAFAVPERAEAVIVPAQNQVTQIWATPRYPEPGEMVTLNVRTSGNTSGYSYAWTVDGDLVGEGTDVTKVSVKAGAIGSTTNVTVTLIDPLGAIRGSRTYVVRPAEVDLVWEGDTVLLPFSKRRPLPNEEGEVVIQAMPRLADGSAALSAKELLYTWEVDGKALGKAAYGKSTVRITPPFFGNTFSVSVIVENANGSIAAEGNTTITPSRADILIYKDHPLSGVMFNRPIQNTALLNEDEVTFRAFPVNVSDTDTLSYQWALDGQPFALNTSDPRIATFRKAGEGNTGSFLVEFSFENAARSFERAARSFRVTLQ